MASMNSEESLQLNRSRWLMWGLVVFFNTYEFLIRVMPSVASDQIMDTFSISPAWYGVLSASYMYAYAPMQLPVGIMVDRLGPRKLLIYAALLCGIGSIILGSIDIYSVAVFGRFLTGAGSAFGFVLLTYICNHWFPQDNTAFLIGLGNAFGMMGAIFGQGPLSYVIDFLGWQMTNVLIGTVGIVFTIIVYLVIQRQPDALDEHDPDIRTKEVVQNMKGVLKNKRTLYVSLLAICGYVPISVFGGLWAVPFIQDTYHVSNTTAGYVASLLFVGYLIGGPIFGKMSDARDRRKPFFIVGSILVSLLFCYLLYVHPESFWIACLIMFFMGVFASIQLLSYSAAIETNILEAQGSVVAVVNFAVFLGVSLFQSLIGYLLFAYSTSNDHVLADYRIAFSLITVVVLTYTALALLFKEEHTCDVDGVKG